MNYGQMPPPNDTKAIVSLVLGILSIVCCYLGFIPGIVAIVLGHLSRSNIRKNMGQLQGAGMALAGLIMGYISCAFIPIMIAAILIPNLVRSRVAANEAGAIGSLRTINTAEIEYQTKYDKRGYAPNLATLGGNCGSNNGTEQRACYIDGTLGGPNCTGNEWCVKSGYKFIVQADESEPHKTYTVTTIPVTHGTTGNRAFCSTDEGIIYYDSAANTRTTPYTQEECKALPAL